MWKAEKHKLRKMRLNGNGVFCIKNAENLLLKSNLQYEGMI